MKIISYYNNYSFYGFFDISMKVFKNGELVPLHDIYNNTDVYNLYGKNEVEYFRVVNAEDISLRDVCYFECETVFDFSSEKKKIKSKDIKITYYTKEFERHIPTIMNKYRNKDYKVKIIFVYRKKTEREFFGVQENLEQFIEWGFIKEENIADILKDIS